MTDPGSINSNKAMYELSCVRSLHLEITSLCNANCPMCPRTDNGGALNPNLYLKDLKLKDFQNFFAPEFIAQLHDIFFCGNYGDPVVAKELLPIWQFLRQSNKEIYLHMHTNGSYRDPEWWGQIAKITKDGSGSVTFAIDGLADTNPMYRQNTNFEKIMENAKAYIDAGGDARWNFFVFEHNEHQVEEAKELAYRMGFSRFLAKKTARFFDYRRGEARKAYPVKNRKGEVVRELLPPKSSIYQNQVTNKLKKMEAQYGSVEAFLDKVPIKCQELEAQRLFISAMGLVLPCCYINHSLFDQRSIYDSANNQVSEIINKDEVNLFKHPLVDILKGPSFQRIKESWNKDSIKSGRLKVCAATCGQNAKRVDAQMEDCVGFDHQEQVKVLQT